MLETKRILILSSANMLLYCSALAELLMQRESFHVDIMEETAFDAAANNIRGHHCLVIHFVQHALALLPSRIPALCGKSTKLMLVLASGDKLSIRALANLDVDGVMFSGGAFSELLTAIHTLVFKNLKYISPHLIAAFSGPAARDPLSTLSRKELDIALIVAQGKRNHQIAAELNISPKTVNTYKTRIYRKLGIDNDMQLLKLTMQA